MARGAEPLMDIPRDLYDRTCAFVRTMADTCRACMRPRYVCDECDLVQSRALVEALEEMGRKPASRAKQTLYYASFKERCAMYEQIVREAGRWMAAREIDPEHRISERGLKYMTLRKMVRDGRLASKCVDDKTYFNIPQKETK